MQPHKGTPLLHGRTHTAHSTPPPQHSPPCFNPPSFSLDSSPQQILSFSQIPPNPQSTAALFSIAPQSITTTVVTTTTTTRTDFPPIFMDGIPEEPLDREVFPLADLETPAVLKEFSVDISGVKTLFREGSAERYNNSSVRSVHSTPTHLRQHFQHPNLKSIPSSQLHQHRQSHASQHIQISSPPKSARKRPAPPESDSEQPDQQTPISISTSRAHKRRASIVSPLSAPSKTSTTVSSTTTSTLDDPENLAGSKSPDLPSPRQSPTQTHPSTRFFSDFEQPTSQPQQPSLAQIPQIVSLYSSLPHQLKTYMLIQLLRKSPFQTLQFITSLILPNLRKDFLARLPLELSYNVIQYLDVRTIGRCAQVSKTWKAVVDGPGAERGVWRRRLVQEGWISPSAHIKQQAGIYKKMYRRHILISRNWSEGRFQLKEFPGHDHFVVTCLQFDTKKIVSGSDDQSINIWDCKTGELKRRLEGHEGGVWALQYWNNVLVSGSTDRTVRVWDMKSGICSHVFEGHTSTIRCMMLVIPEIGENGVLEPEIPLIVTGSRDATLRVWKLPDPESDPGEYITADGGSSGYRRRRKRGDDISVYSAGAENPYFIHVLVGHTHSVRAIAGAGNVLVSGSYDNSVRIWDLKEGKVKHICNGHREKVYSVGYCRKTKIAVSGSMDACVRVWDAVTGNPLHLLEGHTMLVGLLELSPEYLISAAADTKLRIWSPTSGQCLAELSGHAHAITCFHHDPKLNRIVSGSEQGVKLWQLSSQGTTTRINNLPDINRPMYVQGPNGNQPVYGRFVRDLVEGTQHVWRVRMDERRLVCAVQKQSGDGEEGNTCFMVLDFGDGIDCDDEEDDDDDWMDESDSEDSDDDDDMQKGKGLEEWPGHLDVDGDANMFVDGSSAASTRSEEHQTNITELLLRNNPDTIHHMETYRGIIKQRLESQRRSRTFERKRRMARPQWMEQEAELTQPPLPPPPPLDQEVAGGSNEIWTSYTEFGDMMTMNPTLVVTSGKSSTSSLNAAESCSSVSNHASSSGSGITGSSLWNAISGAASAVASSLKPETGTSRSEVGGEEHGVIEGDEFRLESPAGADEERLMPRVSTSSWGLPDVQDDEEGK